MTQHYFENALVKLHYYKFGAGKQNMLCFHGFGMHGKQFKLLEPALGAKYTFWGFDLFFHKQTRLNDQSITAVKKGLTKEALAGLIEEFCQHENISRFSVIGYSMGSHYATAVVEKLGKMVNEYIVAAPSSMNPGRLITFFSKNKTGNKLIEKLTLSEKALVRLVNWCRRLNFIDASSRDILLKEINTPELRFSLYASLTYLRFLETDEPELINSIEKYHIKCIFIFGKRDRMYPLKIGKSFLAKFAGATTIVLDEDHEMINQSFVEALSGLLL